MKLLFIYVFVLIGLVINLLHANPTNKGRGRKNEKAVAEQGVTENSNQLLDAIEPATNKKGKKDGKIKNRKGKHQRHKKDHHKNGKKEVKKNKKKCNCEMVNNRAKSFVVDLKWSNDGTKIAIAYDDGHIIVGGTDGNKDWTKDTEKNLRAITWGQDDTSVIVGLGDGTLHVYDAEGNPLVNLQIIAIETLELDIALDKDVKKNYMVALEYYTPTAPPQLLESFHMDIGIASSTAKAVPVIRQPVNVFRGPVSLYTPRLLIVYQHVIQICVNELDTNPVIVRIPKFVISGAKWSPDGQCIAVAGKSVEDTGDKPVIQFLSVWGHFLRKIRIDGTDLGGFSWDGTTIVYCSPNKITGEDNIQFFETTLCNVNTIKVRHLWHIIAYKDHCMLVSEVEFNPGNSIERGQIVWYCQICNSIGTAVDTKYVHFEPLYVAMNDKAVIISSNENHIIWYYSVPRKMPLASALLKGGKAINTVQNQNINNESDHIFHIDGRMDDERALNMKKQMKGTSDKVQSVCMGQTFFLLFRESGSANRYSLPEGKLIVTYKIMPDVETAGVNCTGKKLAIITKDGIFKFFEINEKAAHPLIQAKENTIAIFEKARLIVYNGTDTEDPVPNKGYLASYEDLTVRTIDMKMLLDDPMNPTLACITDIEVKSLRSVKKMIEAGRMKDAINFIEKNSHPKLYEIIKEVSLMKLDMKTAEYAFVMLKDYSGIRLLKRLKEIKNDDLKRCEILLFLGRLDEAEKIYMENDRRDLAIDMRKKMCDWAGVLRILQAYPSSGDDHIIQQARKKMGDYYMARREWKLAASYYEHGQNFEELFKCYKMSEDYSKIEMLVKRINDGNSLLKDIGDFYTCTGLGLEAVDCYIRCEKFEEALDSCIQLNMWERAVELSKAHNIRDVPSLLSKYAMSITGNNEKTWATVQLYRKAGKYLEGSKILSELGTIEMRKISTSPVKLKKIFVMSGLLIEEYREANKSRIKNKTGLGSSIEASLQGLLDEDSKLTIEESKIIDKGWRGAEAFHFMMIAYRHYYNQDYGKAMVAGMVCSTYDDYLSPEKSHCLIALSSALIKKFYVCCKAFMFLETSGQVSETNRNLFKQKAVDIFTKNVPQDHNVNTNGCPHCGKTIPDFSLTCPLCDFKFSICIVTGLPIFDDTFWLCPRCKHRANEHEMKGRLYCPLCHYDLGEKINRKQI
uniref:ANAPC4_WD40 domain-containing protein n=1 Tax=Rhabditophanes sp. KR3021 TaxID=114890 RepID=A0AC35UH30_9BILA